MYFPKIVFLFASLAASIAAAPLGDSPVVPQLRHTATNIEPPHIRSSIVKRNTVTAARPIAVGQTIRIAATGIQAVVTSLDFSGANVNMPNFSSASNAISTLARDIVGKMGLNAFVWGSVPVVGQFGVAGGTNRSGGDPQVGAGELTTIMDAMFRAIADTTSENYGQFLKAYVQIGDQVVEFAMKITQSN
jgi:hypothetical protein